MTSQKYWQNRLDELEQISNDELIEELNKLYKDLYYQTEKDLLKLLSDFRPSANIDFYNYERYYKLLNNLEENIKQLGIEEVKLFDDRLPKFYIQVQEHLDKLNGNRSNFSHNNIEEAKVVAKEIWCVDGKNYSDRIWNNKAKLKEVIQNNLAACFIGGASANKFREELMKSFGVGYARANTLVRTEMKHCAMESRVAWARRNGFKNYIYHTTGMPNVCSPECEQLEGKKFSLSVAKPGVNMPPTHPNCQCYITFE